jgi:hypothetical protein
MRPFECVCSKELQLPDSNQQDIKCPNCGRVYTANGRYLWRESPGNDVPGSSDIDNTPFIAPEEDRRADDQDEAVVAAFVEGTLPEEDRRAEEPVTETVVETPAAPPASKSTARGDKRSR